MVGQFHMDEYPGEPSGDSCGCIIILVIGFMVASAILGIQIYRVFFEH